MKKLFSIFAAFLLMFVGANSAFSKQIKDVPADYWAAKEIDAVVVNGYMNLDKDGSFKPETDVTRAQFNSMLLRTLGHQNADIASSNNFTDVNKTHWAYGDILKSQELGLIYGYPDKTFKPEQVITKSEAASIISHITKDTKVDMSALDKFKDSNSIATWAKTPYAKSINLNIYVNYPNADELLPNKVLNRAEAAVLLYKLQAAMNMVQDKFVAKEILLGTEHLAVYDKAPVNEVKLTNFRKIILSQNVVKVNFAEPFSSKRTDVGKQVNFVFNQDVCTKEGTLVIPKRTQLVGYVNTLKPQEKFNKNAEVTLNFSKLILPSGKEVNFQANVLNDKDGVLTASKLATIGKVSAYTAGGAAIGAGAGVGFAAIPNPKKYGIGSAAIGLPVGAGVGLATGLITPGLAYSADEKDTLLLLITTDVSVPNK